MGDEVCPELNITDWDAFLEKSKLYFNENWTKKKDDNQSLDDYETKHTIGTGSFGRVILAKSKDDDVFYAIKILEKKQVLKTKQLDHTLNEKRLLQTISFPFIIKMEAFFKDNVYLYFVMPYIIGGELFSHLRKAGRFPEAQSVFYASQVVLALEYLHFMNIAYRDLKPENILIDQFGYIKLTDLGFCKIVQGRTYTLCGTPEYLAPEIILSKGYGLAVDWWALGIFIYEMCAGYPPFYSNEPMKIYEQIAVGKYRMIPSFSADLKNLVKNLLQNDMTKRFGNLKDGVVDIKEHPWFKNIVWIEILNRKVHPPFVPNVSGDGDSSNFSKYEEEPFKQSAKVMFEAEFQNF